MKGDVIRAGERVVVMAGAGRSEQLTVEPGKMHRNKWGRFDLTLLVGRNYGERIDLPTLKATGKGKNRQGGYIYVLKPRPELLAEGAMTLQTAIVDPVDSAHIVWSLALKPGSVVVEAGTGSGSLTRGLARAVAPSGWVLTFEFHRGRADKARAALQAEQIAKPRHHHHQPSFTLSLSEDQNDAITGNDDDDEEGDEIGEDKLIEMNSGAEGEGDVVVTHRDVVKHGFGNCVADASVHAVMLDLPTPWDVVAEARRVLKPQGRVCCYSPCIEQVQKNCKALRQHGFGNIVTEEVVQRPYHLYDPPQVYDPVDYELFVTTTAKRPLPQSQVAQQWWYNPFHPAAPQHAIPAPSIRGHTAFLTFATLPPSLPSSPSSSGSSSSSSST